MPVLVWVTTTAVRVRSQPHLAYNQGMTKRRIGIVILLTLSVLVAVAASLTIAINSSLFAGYYYREFYITPAHRYAWVFMVGPALALVYGLWMAVRLWNSDGRLRPLFVVFAIALLAVPAQYAASFVRLDIPYSHKLAGTWYSIPWTYGPDGHDHESGSYLRANVSYPGFAEPVAFEKVKQSDGFNLLLSKQTDPDLLCFGDIGCLHKRGVKRSTVPLSEQLLDRVKANVDVRDDVPDLQTATQVQDGLTTTYFVRYDPHSRSPTTYGFCTGPPRYVLCHYLHSAEGFYHNVSVRSHSERSVEHWRLERDLETINEKTVELFNSFRR